MAEWYYFQGGNQQGPVTEDQIRGMVSSGQLNASDSVWKNGMANWAPISSIPELAPAASAPPRGNDYDRGYDDRGGGRDAGYDDYRAPRPVGPRGGLISIWSIILLSGGALWFINTFLPWYSVGAGGFGPSVTVLGISVGTGLFAFIISFFILGGVITSWFVPIVAEWRWTGAFFFALMGLILLILGFFNFRGGYNSVGPFIHIFATLAVLAGAILEGVFGLLAFLAKQKRRA